MILFLIFLLLLFLIYYHFYYKRKGLPPSPLPLPIVGNFPQLNKYGLEDALVEFRKEYGDIYTIWFGETPIVFISDVPTILETFVKDADTYAWRPLTNLIARERTLGKYGLIFNDGYMWKHHRRSTLQVFRDFGMGKNLMQERILVEVDDIINQTNSELKTTNIINIQRKIDVAIGSIINNLLFGYRFDSKRLDEFYRLKSTLQYHVKSVGKPLARILNVNPTLYKCFPKFVMNDYYKSLDDLRSFFHRQIEEHKKKIDFSIETDATDYVEDFLRKKEKYESEGDLETYSEEQLFGACVDLWLAGQETTSNTIGWGILYMMNYPECQDKVHQELDSVINSDRFITSDDRMNLNYLNAVIAEIQRFCNLVPLNVLHRTAKDINIQGYTIPKDTVITHNIGTVLRDERYFPEPDKFKPERFLDKNGKFFQPVELMPFGVGKRSCLGEGLARLELLLLIGNLLNQYKFEIDPKNPPNMTRVLGGTIAPNEFIAKIIPRF